ncbi:uncharacterized protein LOC128231191 [Mya arenaria]|uniref:uncharacterized protein LOC128231191 n=1 Tax=Mya arenaria TaxID=6604 RepID=UPI0022E69D71|nr:uncharacterized protein LOC128231191 [Mya arenaria]XP_052799643.1 uncharacterized protein LOC128231191 [Mya arenaria]
MMAGGFAVRWLVEACGPLVVFITVTWLAWRWGWLVTCLAATVILHVDVHVLWRKPLVATFCRLRRKVKKKILTDSNEFKVICLPTDVNPLTLSMTPDRLLRECSIGHVEFWVENYADDVIRQLHASLTLTECSYFHNAPIKLFDKFRIEAKIFHFDETSLYLEQRVIRYGDEKLCACVLSRHVITGSSTGQLFAHLSQNTRMHLSSKDEHMSLFVRSCSKSIESKKTF